MILSILLILLFLLALGLLLWVFQKRRNTTIEYIVQTKEERQQLQGNLRRMFVFVLDQDPLTVSRLTGSLGLVLETLVQGADGKTYVMIDNVLKFEKGLSELGIPYQILQGLIVGGLYPVYGGYNKVLEQAGQPVDILFQDLVGNLVLVSRDADTIDTIAENIKDLVISRDRNFGVESDVIEFKVKRQLELGNYYPRPVFIYRDDPLRVTGLTRTNQIVINSLYSNNGLNYVIVDQPDFFESLLQKEGLEYTRTSSLTVAPIKPIAGSLAHSIEALGDQPNGILIDELGNVVFLLPDTSKYPTYIQRLESVLDQ